MQRKAGDYMNNKEIFAQNLNYYMNEKKKSRKEVANSIGVSYFTFTDWVKGKTYPRMDKVEKLAKYFDIKISDLVEKKSTKEETMTIGNLFEYMRKQRKLSVSEFSAEIGISEKDIRSYESSKDGIPFEVVKTLANYFDIPLESLTTKQVKTNDIFAAFASTNDAYVKQMSRWVEIFGNERLSDEEFEKLVEYGKFIISQRKRG